MTPADRPVRATDVALRRRSDDGVALLERHGRYVQLSAAAAAIWEWCDGTRDVDAIARAYRECYAVDGTPAITTLLAGWHETGFVASSRDAPRASADVRARSVMRRGASIFVAWSIERWSARLESVAHMLFAPSVLIALAVIALAGGALALHIAPRAAIHGTAESVALAVGLVFAVILHEAGHALTLAHFGGTVRRAGIGWYWCAPLAFVDTSDAHALPRAARIAVSLAGPAASFVVAALATLVASSPLPESIRAVAWSLALINYGISLWNLNPLIELDGYYVLTDLLDRPNLRSDAFGAIRRMRPTPVELAYAGGALTYAATFIAVVLPAAITHIAPVLRALTTR